MRRFYTILFFLLTLTAQANTYFISKVNGNDANTGKSALLAWQNLSRLNSAAIDPGDVVMLERGSVWREMLPLNQSGTAGNRIKFAAYGTGAAPLITGFISLQSWTNVGGNIWQASVNSGTYMNMVTSNGVPLQRGRYPNRSDLGTDSGWLFYEAINGFTQLADNNYPDLGVQNWNTGANPWITFRSNDFQINTYKLTGQSKTGGVTTFTYDGSSDTMHSTPSVGNGYFIQNDPRTLDQQGEWYYNPSVQLLSIYSTVNPATLNIQAATLDYLINTMNRSYITIDGIEFTGANRMNIRWSTGTGDSIKNCNILLAGGAGAEMKFHTALGIKNCTFQYCNRRGLELTLGIRSSITYSNIFDIGLVRGAAGRDANGDQSLQGAFINGDSVYAKYNTVKRTGYAGISGTQDSIYVEYNFVDSTNMVTDDAGGIYFGDANRNAGTWRYMRYNTIMHSLGCTEGTGRPKWYKLGQGAYCDEASENVVIKGNTIAYNSDRGIYLHDNRHVIIDSNIVFDNRHYALAIIKDQAQPGVLLRNITITNNRFISTSNRVSRSTTEENGLIWLVTDNTDINDLKLFGTANNNYFFKGFYQNQADVIRITTGINTGNRQDSSYTLPTWYSMFGQDAGSKLSGINYRPFSLSAPTANTYSTGNFNSIANVLNYTGSTTSITQDTHKMDGPSFRMDTTSAGSNGNPMEPWFYPSGGTDWPVPTGNQVYVVEFDGMTNSARETDFQGYIRGTGSAEGKTISFKMASDRRHITLIFDSTTIDHTIIGHYFAMYTQVAAQAGGTFWIDNLKVYSATISYANWRDYMDFQYAHSQPVIVNPPGSFTNRNGVKKGRQFLMGSYSAEELYSNSNLKTVNGFVKTRVQ